MEKLRILVLFGGESVEHEISIITANQVMSALQINHTVIPVYISKNNKLYYVIIQWHKQVKQLRINLSYHCLSIL